jgi:hypothetical protein
MEDPGQLIHILLIRLQNADRFFKGALAVFFLLVQSRPALHLPQENTDQHSAEDDQEYIDKNLRKKVCIRFFLYYLMFRHIISSKTTIISIHDLPVDLLLSTVFSKAESIKKPFPER